MAVYYYLPLLVSLFCTALTLKFLIPVLKSKKMGQKILDIGPRWHKSKEGTPTMGGISFIAVFAVIVAVMLPLFYRMKVNDNITVAVITALFALGNGLIGVIDDRTKFSKGKNEGLLSWQKYLLQLILTVIYLFFMFKTGHINTTLYIPFIKTELELGILYYPFSVLLITGIINSVNLTDGIDGLAASQTALVSVYFSVIAFALQSYTLGLFAGVALGGCLGFLVYNFYPARVFMGDTGSLFLGALVIGMAYMANNPFITVFIGIIYITETLSDIIQVGYFKLTHGKRIFKMAPIHHHFEKCGWSEVKIVTVFSLVTVLMCALSYLFG